jgi:hypothetical protein
MGWIFTKDTDSPIHSSRGKDTSYSCEGTVHDDVFNSKTVRDIYEKYSKGS